MKKLDQMAPDLEAVIEDVTGDLPRLVPVKHAAERLGLHPSTIRRWGRQGKIVVVKTAKGRAAGKVFVPRVEIVRLLRSMAS